jgi:CDP-paratose 2-epimerase
VDEVRANPVVVTANRLSVQNLITGGAGFIGCNLADRLLGRGERVVVFDNFSRVGAERNLAWLEQRHGADRLTVARADVRDAAALAGAAANADRIYHLAGQVAVTTSVEDPRSDFEANALGTLNALEAARRSPRNPTFLYSSTNKVYGGLEGVRIAEDETRYHLADLPRGVSEQQPLDFHSPYGCSKGCGDQYTRDYARIYGLRTVVLRQSCIYGYRQMGMEDQGWLAWFAIAALRGERITIYGDGKQVRDVLFIDDLLDAFDCAIERIDRTAGSVFNIGGGPASSLSVWREFGPLLERQLGRPIETRIADWRPGDQRVYVSDIDKAKRELGWEPRIGVEEGISRLVGWVSDHRELFGAG